MDRKLPFRSVAQAVGLLEGCCRSGVRPRTGVFACAVLGGLAELLRRSRGIAGGTCRHEGRSAASARQGRTTKAMPKHRRGVLPPYGTAPPLCATSRFSDPNIQLHLHSGSVRGSLLKPMLLVETRLSRSREQPNHSDPCFPTPLQQSLHDHAADSPELVIGGDNHVTHESVEYPVGHNAPEPHQFTPLGVDRQCVPAV